MCDRCAELEEQVRQLEAIAFGHAWVQPPYLRLSRAELAIVQTLLAHDRPIDDATLFLATRVALNKYGDEKTDGTVIKVWVSKIRSKFTPHGLQIQNVFGFGYQLPFATRDKLLNWSERRAA